MQVADSLFEESKFTESFEIYKAIHEIGEHVSSAMLLKMAYIQEGLGNESGALYYLNMYYLQTTNEKAFEKMGKLAQLNGLKGYGQTDRDWFLNIYYTYYYHLLICLLGIALLIFLVVFYKKIKLDQRSYSGGIGIVVVVALLFWAMNFGREYKRAILVKDDTYMMGAPSAGAEVLDILKAGHRVKVLGRQDVWLEIELDNQIGYVKNTQLKQLFF